MSSVKIITQILTFTSLDDYIYINKIDLNIYILIE